MEIIWGIQFDEVVLLAKQVGLAIMGAPALWGLVFSITDIRKKYDSAWIIDDWISMRIFILFMFGLLLSVASHIISLPALTAYAHEGITVPSTSSEILATYPLNTILFMILISGTIFMLLLYNKNKERFSYIITPFYAIAFALTFFIISFNAWRGYFDGTQIFFFIHGFHSIFTLGTVIVLDFLFLISSRSEILKQHIYELFPTISRVIWVGLSLDFISVYFITDAFIVTEKLLFTQTVVGILIINGVLLSGPIARKMIEAVKTGGQPASKWRRIGSFSGALSITSWLTITALDFFTQLTLNYQHLALLYLSVFICAFIGHTIFEKRFS